MQVNENISPSIGQVHPHMLYNTAAHGRGWKLETMIPDPVEDEISKSEEQEVHKEINGQFGTIRILKPHRQVTEADEDIHTLIARILLKKQERLASGE
ncbi:hypothetical protein QYF48_16105 [Brevibacillus agri]|uniref:hypothetical protein n=1 Tax=Brevibacillus agri TaxID=51101 RepID=UPI0025B6D1F5|nr:hypothetical protein [Brevibacillus agri]MDN4094332.1 hypothetical protein [Brevibacillus agri]